MEGGYILFFFSVDLAALSLDLENPGSWREVAWLGVTFQQGQGIHWPVGVSTLGLSG